MGKIYSIASYGWWYVCKHASVAFDFKKIGKEKKHTVSAGETLRYISQKYAVQLNSIFKYNNLNENSVIHPNDIILLKH